MWFWLVPVMTSLLLAGCSREDPTTGPSTPLPAHPKMLVFGDSYTQGIGASSASLGYAYQLGAKLGGEVTVDGAGGTGYLNPGGRGTFLTRVEKATPGPFDVIVLQGSTNDKSQSLAELAPAINATVSKFRAKYPEARIIILGLILLNGSASPTDVLVNDTLKTYASDHGLIFIDPIAEAWFIQGESETMVNPNDKHPNDAGHLRIRDRLADDLLRMIKTPSPG